MAGARPGEASSKPQRMRTGHYSIGSPETVAAKVARLQGSLGADRFEMKYSSGTLPHAQMTRSIELFGSKVSPRVADILAGS